MNRWIAALVLSAGLAGCAKGGTARFFDENNNSWNPGFSNPSVQVGSGGSSMLVEAGKTPETGIHGSVVLKADNGSVHTGGGYTMTVNAVKVE